MDKGVETEAVGRILFPDVVARTVYTRLDADQEADLEEEQEMLSGTCVCRWKGVQPRQ